MPIVVEVNLKVPSLTVRSAVNPDKKIDNRHVRFSRRIHVQAIPTPGQTLQLPARFGEPFECTVSRADWSEEKNLFIVACLFARRSITEAEHDALVTDPEWVMKELPS